MTATDLNLAEQVSGTLAVGNGGSGATTLTGLLKGNGTSAFTAASAGTDYAGVTTTQTLSATRLSPRVGTGTTSAGAITVNTDNVDVFTATLTAATTFTFSGTPTHGQGLLVECVDNGTARVPTWPSGNSADSGVATRLATTVISKVHRVFFVYDINKTKWICMAVDAVGY